MHLQKQLASTRPDAPQCRTRQCIAGPSPTLPGKGGTSPGAVGACHAAASPALTAAPLTPRLRVKEAERVAHCTVMALVLSWQAMGASLLQRVRRWKPPLDRLAGAPCGLLTCHP